MNWTFIFYSDVKIGKIISISIISLSKFDFRNKIIRKFIILKVVYKIVRKKLSIFVLIFISTSLFIIFFPHLSRIVRQSMSSTDNRMCLRAKQLRQVREIISTSVNLDANVKRKRIVVADSSLYCSLSTSFHITDSLFAKLCRVMILHANLNYR